MKTWAKKYKRQFNLLLLITLLLNILFIVFILASDSLFREIKNRNDALYYMYLNFISLGTSNTYNTTRWEYFILVFIGLSCYLFLGISLFVFLRESYRQSLMLKHYIKQHKTRRAIYKAAKHKKRQA